MILNKRMTRRFEKKIIPIVCIAFFTLSGCTSKQQSEISIYYTPETGEYIHNALKLSTDDAYELPIETLEQAEEKGKIILSLADGGSSGAIRFMVDSFNCENEKYHIERNVYANEELNEKREKLKIELATGKGPDLMTYSAMPYVYEIMDKGCFVDLVPLMKQSGITDDLYFPSYKAITYKDFVYGLSPSGNAVGRAISKDVIGGKEIPSYEVFVDAVLNYSKDAVFINDTQKSEKILEYFLEGSENLWGMIDWENGVCDFHGELFSKILDIVKRYSEARNKGYKPIAKNVWLTPGSDSRIEQYEKDGFVIVNFWFDDGNFPMNTISNETLMINANTQNIEGAWAFISYCLSERGQSYNIGSPVKKSVYDLIFEDYRALYDSEKEADKYYPRSQIEDYKHKLETGKYVPYKVNPIINIIEEEAGAYWSGSKSKEDVIDIIQNRVSVFLKE